MRERGSEMWKIVATAFLDNKEGSVAWITPFKNYLFMNSATFPESNN